MVERRDDIIALPIMEGLAAAVELELRDSGLADVAFAGVRPGEEVAFDYVEDDSCGQAWVRLSTAVPSSSFPTQNESPMMNWVGVATEFEVGIVRCIPVEDARPLTVEEYLSATSDQLADMAAMRRAICKYLMGLAQLPKGKREWILGAYSPLGPEGGGFGGSWTVAVYWASPKPDAT